jgi:GMP synthase (glutamine-hydrolysing)
MVKEITVQELNTENFIDKKVKKIQQVVGDGMAINALSGGVDSFTVTMLGHRTLGNRLKSVFIENGLMREGESEKVVGLFKKLGVTVNVVDSQKEFIAALEGITDPEEKREVDGEIIRDVPGIVSVTYNKAPPLPQRSKRSDDNESTRSKFRNSII